MSNKFKAIFFIILIGLLSIIIIELFSFILLKIYYYFHIKRSEYRKVFEDSQLYLSLKRFHPLFANNEDLRARNPDFDFDSIVGYKFAPNTIQVRPPSPEFKGHIEIDSEGFPHNGDCNKNEEFLRKPPDKIFRVVFFGGSTTVGRGASSNEYTIPAFFERCLAKEWLDVKFHVINAGNFGYQSTQERLYYSFYIKRLKPDLLIFLDGDNEIFCAACQKEWIPYFQSMSFNNNKYRSLFRPKAAFGTYLKSLITFPQSFYTLFLIDKVLYKARAIRNKLIEFKEYSVFTFHKEAVSQYHDNLLTTAREISFEKSRAIFCLQPILGVKKNKKSGSEEDILKKISLSSPNLPKIINKYFDNFSKVYEELAREFSNSDKISFIDISNIFENNNQNIYVSLWHYNNYGNKIIAERIFDYAKEKIKEDLIRKGLIKDND